MMNIDNCDDILIALMMMMMTLTEARLSIRYSTHFFYPFVGNANFDDCNGLAMDMTMMMVMKKKPLFRIAKMVMDMMMMWC